MPDLTYTRKDFPQLTDGTLHYLDSAATSLTPSTVLDAEIEYYTHSRASVHRGVFKEAERATTLYEEARAKVAAFIGGEPDEVIFTSGATDSSNMLVRMLEESLHITRLRKNIVTTVMEHHAALLPLQQFALRRDLALLSIPLRDSSNGPSVALDDAKGDAYITDDTAIVSVVLASNVTGEINDIIPLIEKAHAHKAIAIVDATAAVGHIPVDVRELGCDALYFSGHKMFAPTGIGVLWVRRDLLRTLAPSVFGGHMIARMNEGTPEWAEIPARFEAGTKNISGVIGLSAAIEYVTAVGTKEIHAYVGTLVTEAIARLSEIEGVTVIAERDPARNAGIVAFSASWAHPHDIAEVLARNHVAVRPGHHCAIPLHSAFGIESSVRASFHCYNTKEDVDALIEGVKQCKELFS